METYEVNKNESWELGYRQGESRELEVIWDYWLSHTTEEFAEWLTDRAENYLVGN